MSRDLLYGLLAGANALESGVSEYQKVKALRGKLANEQAIADYHTGMLNLQTAYHTEDTNTKKNTELTNELKDLGMSREDANAGINLLKAGKSPTDPGLSPTEKYQLQGVTSLRERLAEKADKTKEHRDWTTDQINSRIKSLEAIQAGGMKLSPEQQSTYDALTKQANGTLIPDYHPVKVTSKEPVKETSFWGGIKSAASSFLGSSDLNSGLKAEKIRRQNAQQPANTPVKQPEQPPKDSGLMERDYGAMSNDGKLRVPKKSNTFGSPSTNSPWDE